MAQSAFRGRNDKPIEANGRVNQTYPRKSKPRTRANFNGNGRR